MPLSNFYLIAGALLVYACCSTVTLQDRVLLYTKHYIENYSIYEPKEKELFKGAMCGLFNYVADIYSMYISPDITGSYEDELNNRYNGVGIKFLPKENGKPAVVSYPILDSPAYRNGIRSGDTVSEINGQAAASLTLTQITDIIAQNETVKMSVVPCGETNDEKLMHITVQRSAVKYDSVEGFCIDDTGRRVFRIKEQPDIGYVHVNSFTDSTVTELTAALKTIPDVRGLILDLRDNPGGFVHSATDAAGLFLKATEEQNVIVTERFRSGKETKIRLPKNADPVCTIPLVVLINEKSASAAEILAAALQDYHRAKIVGQRSFGKGIVQQMVPLPFDCGLLQLTGASYVRPSGKNIHLWDDQCQEWGVMPDILIEESENVMQYRSRSCNAVFRSGEQNRMLPVTDTVLERAMQLFKQ